ncbi:DUF2254 domain-containing protein [Devosia enhydra]|nr:DUF2254 domain-containing protein [Devosia enhydra]
MISKWRWLMLQLTRQLWVRASLFAVLGVITALLAMVVERFIPWELPSDLGSDAVDSILNILATSMLSVTTFSLSVMVSAYSAATSSVTPRATRLLMQDSTTQNALATFMGSFLFSLVGIITLSTGAYGERGRVVLFVVTILVIALIVVTMLRWIDHLSRLGRVGETTDQVEEVAAEAIAERLRHPALGARPADAATTLVSGTTLSADRVGYVQYVDMAALEAAAEAGKGEVMVLAMPGIFVHSGKPLARFTGECDPETLRKAFSIGTARSFDQDPRFGVVVLAEIAARALSPAVNDPGTAIDVIGRMVRVLEPLALPPEAEEPGCARVHGPALSIDDLFDDGFGIIARDGAGALEVQIRLQKALQALAEAGDGRLSSAARRHAELALARAEAALSFAPDREALRHLARQ